MDRRLIIASLIRFDQPLAELEAAVATLDWDAEPVGQLTRKDIADVLRRYQAGLLKAGEIGRWASLVECREDLEFEMRHEAVVADAIFDLANPDVQGTLPDIVEDLLAALQR
ncbi:hypothetical protein Q4F19_12120 [Sphingomonas sp. BIUV-7]|uniref:Uncharacterized protein n=1 Tax=Sphingomonas natans TaxID=3063330 RepID=A0ABT8Y9X0_9SPHN|nr:hypothetical protein [Sphingomonas sp. BIUV-7]MDO6415128.1 hypothetical protein [Sphingomonas sp. BIUV-7]